MPIYILDTHTTSFDNDANACVINVCPDFIERVRELVDVFRYGASTGARLYAVESFDGWADFYPSIDTEFDERIREVETGISVAPDDWEPDALEQSPYDGEAQTILVGENEVWFRILPPGEGAEINSVNLPLWRLGLAGKPAWAVE